MLKTFTSRSNVKSVIILSRTDGSIIHATGLPQLRGDTSSRSRAYNITQSNDGSVPSFSSALEVSKDDDEAESQKEETSHAQRLASTIYEFVGASSKLAACVQEASILPDATGSDAHRSGAEGNENSAGTENDVQLLRMRTRKQEIIIYPDQNYLCCVIQNLPGSASGGGPP